MNWFTHSDLRYEVINELSDRGAMGLSEAYCPTRLATISKDYQLLGSHDRQGLISLLESRSALLSTRIAAGNLLALYGDPRLDPLAPAMCKVEGGKIGIGLDPSQISLVHERYIERGVRREWIEKETPRLIRQVESFAIAKYPITNSEYLAFLHENKDGEVPTSWVFGRYPEERGNHPVHSLSALAADAYAAWLARKTKRGFRLPTEAEWEYAAAGRDGLEFPWGQDFLPDHANVLEEGILTTTPVGAFPNGASPCGACDMAGNVEEYVSDNFQAYDPGVQVVDDLFIADRSYRVARGGSFTRFSDLARTRRRHGRYGRSIYVMGMRVAETL